MGRFRVSLNVVHENAQIMIFKWLKLGLGMHHERMGVLKRVPGPHGGRVCMFLLWGVKDLHLSFGCILIFWVWILLF